LVSCRKRPVYIQQSAKRFACKTKSLAKQSALSERNAVHFVWSHNAPEGCRHGTHTNLMGRPTYEAPTREYTHKHKQTHNAARQSTLRCGLAPWRRPPHQRRAPRPHPQQAASLSRSPTPKASYVHRHRKALCLQREGHVDVDQLTSFLLRSRTAVSLACSAPCPASVGRAACLLYLWLLKCGGTIKPSVRGRHFKTL